MSRCYFAATSPTEYSLLRISPRTTIVSLRLYVLPARSATPSPDISPPPYGRSQGSHAVAFLMQALRCFARSHLMIQQSAVQQSSAPNITPSTLAARNLVGRCPKALVAVSAPIGRPIRPTSEPLRLRVRRRRASASPKHQ